jgi:hypothetical protein
MTLPDIEMTWVMLSAESMYTVLRVSEVEDVG